MRQQENRAPGACPPNLSPALDAIRLDQFLALLRDLTLATEELETLPDRLVQRIAILLGVRGAALCVIDEDRYRVLGAYGIGPIYRRRYEATYIRDSELIAAITNGRPLALNDLDGNAAVTTLVLPFRSPDPPGALQVVLGEHAVLPDRDLDLACTIAGLAGVALTNARHCAQLAHLAHLKGDALATMAHDLRSPLNALLGYASLLAEGAFGSLSREQRDVAATLERQALDIIDLLAATLDVARLESGRLPLRMEEFTLADVVATLREGTFAQASNDGRLGWFVAPDLPRLHSDRVKLKEIIQNLVDNALKHSNGHPVIVEAVLAPEREVLRIAVRDMGDGIAADILPNLFEPYRPGSHPADRTGFGLYIVRCFTQALGGRVAARSTADVGTTITVEVPLAAPGAATGKPKARTSCHTDGNR